MLKLTLLVLCAIGCSSREAKLLGRHKGSNLPLDKANQSADSANPAFMGSNSSSADLALSKGLLESGSTAPVPGEGESHSDKKHNKRQFYLPPLQTIGTQSYQQQQPHFPFIPIYIPYRQVVEVHHAVMLQPPSCVPGTYPQPTPAPYPQPQPGTYPRPQPGTFPQQPGYPYQPQPQPSFPQPTTTEQPIDMGLDDRAGPMGGQNMTMPSRPSRCVWAIVACCSPDSTSIRYSCFELLGCPGAFWGVNPCESRVVQAAANTALNFYMAGGTDENGVDQNRV